MRVGIITDGNRRYGKLQDWDIEQVYKEWANHCVRVSAWLFVNGIEYKDQIFYISSKDNMSKRREEEKEQIAKYSTEIVEMMNDDITLLMNYDYDKYKDLKIDLIIRPGKVQRLSGFPASPYSELRFPDIYFPELSQKILEDILEDYANTERRFGE
tara:strand:- start:637 stop:1104 length:468 start_codon:yes stop_codon:yes gene_type:complete